MTEQQALHAARSGDSAGFDFLYRMYYDSIVSVCRYFVGPNDAPDLAQESFMSAMKMLPSFKEDAQFRTWMGVIAKRKCLDVLIKNQNRNLLMDLHRVNQAKFVSPSADSHAILSQIKERMPEGKRDILFRFYEDGASEKELAREMGISLPCVKIRLFRARKAAQEFA